MPQRGQLSPRLLATWLQVQIEWASGRAVVARRGAFVAADPYCARFDMAKPSQHCLVPGGLGQRSASNHRAVGRVSRFGKLVLFGLGACTNGHPLVVRAWKLDREVEDKLTIRERWVSLRLKPRRYWASVGTDQNTGQPITTREWSDRPSQ